MGNLLQVLSLALVSVISHTSTLGRISSKFFMPARNHNLLLVVVLLLGSPCVHAQAHLSCPARPATLTVMRHCYRPLLVFSPSVRDARLKQQQAALDADADDMMDRFVLLTPFVPGMKGYQGPLDTPYVILNAQQAEAARHRFQVSAGQFAVVLLDEDGREKLRSDKPVSTTRLNRLIDSMPIRKWEMQQPHAN